MPAAARRKKAPEYRGLNLLDCPTVPTDTLAFTANLSEAQMPAA